MSVTPGTGGHRPRETREPGEAFICRPVQARVGFSKRDYFELVSVWVFEELDVNPSAPDPCVVAAGERQPTRVKVNVRPVCQLMSARPAQYQGGRAGVPLGSARIAVLVQAGIKHKYNVNDFTLY